MKRFMSVFAALFLVGCACVEKPLLRIAVTSDAQAINSTSCWGIANTEKAFDFLSQFKPDVVVMAGDLADRADPAVFPLYMNLYRKYFPHNPVHVACAGNHDFRPVGNVAYEDLWNAFADGLQISRDNPGHQVVRGYDFITLTEEHCDFYSAEMLSKVKAELDAAVARDSGKPIFLVTHYPPRDTMIGSQTGVNARAELRTLLNNYPQVISLSGHTHRPLECETAIWQGEFTALTTATLSYACIGGGDKYFNVAGGTIPPYAREVQQALLIDIFKNRVEIHRYNVHERREINPDELWVVDIPYNPATARLTQARAETAVAPEFPGNAVISMRHDFGFAYLIFTPAKHDRFVFSYIMRASVKNDDGSWTLVQETEHISDFYRYIAHRATEFVIKLPEKTFRVNKIMKFEIFPQEEFGKCGKPLVLEMLVPPEWNMTRRSKLTWPQE